MVIKRNLYQVFLGIVYTLSDSVSNFIGFAQSVAYYAIAVSNNYDSSKAESSTTFNYFGNTVDSYYSFL